MFLKSHVPFSVMADDHLIHLAENAQLRFFADGDLVLTPDGGSVKEFYIIKQGQITGERTSARGTETETTFEISAGESFAVAALLAERPTRTLHWAIGDTFVITLDRAHFLGLFSASEPFRDFCLRGVSALLDQVQLRTQTGAMAAMGASTLAIPLSNHGLRQPVVCSADTSVRDAVRRMNDGNVGSIIITNESRQPIGIFTLRDLREMVAESGTSLDTAVVTVMSPNPQTLTTSAKAFDAALKMAEHRVTHLCVVDETGRLAGVVSEHDLFSRQRVDLVHLARTISFAPTLDVLIAMRSEITRLVAMMLAHGADASQVLQIISTLNDCTVQRTIELNLERYDPEVNFTWIAFGSEGRREQTLRPVRSNGILFESQANQTPSQQRERLLPLVRAINADLHKCGLPLVTSGELSHITHWCMSHQEWLNRIDQLTRRADDDALKTLQILCDARPVYGPRRAGLELAATVHEIVRHSPDMISRLAEIALRRSPSPDQLRDLDAVTEGILDLKNYGLVPLVDGIRLIAVEHGISATNTLERLEQLKSVSSIDAREIGAWQEAYGLIQLIRLREQQESLLHEAPVTHGVPLERLTRLDRRTLREAFRQGLRLQRYIRSQHLSEKSPDE